MDGMGWDGMGWDGKSISYVFHQLFLSTTKLIEDTGRDHLRNTIFPCIYC